MGKIFDIILLALHSLSVHLVRSGLTMLGIVFGVCSVSVMLAIQTGASVEAAEKLSVLGSNNIIINSIEPAKETQEMAETVLRACPDIEWQMIFALCRYGGLRCPSEVLRLKWADVDWARPRPVRVKEYSFSNAIASAALAVSSDLDLKALAVYTETGHSAGMVSSCRPRANILAISSHEEVLRRLTLRWGVVPAYSAYVNGIEEVVDQAERSLLKHGLVSPGQDIAITFGTQYMSGPGRTDVLKLWRVRGDAAEAEG